jgi:hypothetical protein
VPIDDAKKISLTMHDDELSYEIFVNIFEESIFAAILWPA